MSIEHFDCSWKVSYPTSQSSSITRKKGHDYGIQYIINELNALKGNHYLKFLTHFVFYPLGLTCLSLSVKFGLYCLKIYGILICKLKNVPDRVELHCIAPFLGNNWNQWQMRDLTGPPSELKDHHKHCIIRHFHRGWWVSSCKREAKNKGKTEQHAQRTNQIPELPLAVTPKFRVVARVTRKRHEQGVGCLTNQEDESGFSVWEVHYLGHEYQDITEPTVCT